MLRLAGRQAVAAGHRLLDPRRLEREAAGTGAGAEAFAAAVSELVDARRADARLSPSGKVAMMRLSEAGLRHHLEAEGTPVARVVPRVVAALRTDEAGWAGNRAVDLAAAVGEPPLVVEAALEDLAARRLVVFSRAPGGRVRIHRLSPAPAT